jgi:methylthioribulose-1-phosphate dehydratase
MHQDADIAGAAAPAAARGDGGERADDAVAALIDAGRRAAPRQWLPSTSGNFSVRVDVSTIAITRSGTDKAALSRADILFADLAGPGPGASAEAPLHYALYREDPNLQAVFHVHSHAATVLSRGVGPGSIRLEGWELLKALSGVRSHEETVEIPVFENDQDTTRLAEEVSRRFAARSDARLAPGYAIAGHGLYAWGASAREAWRHTEALETLLSYELSRRTLLHERLKA